MSTKMTDMDWANALEVFRSCLPRRGRKAADDVVDGLRSRHRNVPKCGCRKSHEGEPFMEKITTIGLDIAKHVFQVHGINGACSTVSRRKLRRDDVVGFFRALPPCLIGIEACATGHHWARVLWHSATRFG